MGWHAPRQASSFGEDHPKRRVLGGVRSQLSSCSRILNFTNALHPFGATVWTSTLRRTIITASGLHYPKVQWKALDEIQVGTCAGRGQCSGCGHGGAGVRRAGYGVHLGWE